MRQHADLEPQESTSEATSSDKRRGRSRVHGSVARAFVGNLSRQPTRANLIDFASQPVDRPPIPNGQRRRRSRVDTTNRSRPYTGYTDPRNRSANQTAGAQPSVLAGLHERKRSNAPGEATVGRHRASPALNDNEYPETMQSGHL